MTPTTERPPSVTASSVQRARRQGVRPSARDEWLLLAAALDGQSSRVPCQVHPAPFFAADDAAVAEARTACTWCPVQRECLEFAQANSEAYGVWGGSDPTDRARAHARERRQRRTRSITAGITDPHSAAAHGSDQGEHLQMVGERMSPSPTSTRQEASDG